MSLVSYFWDSEVHLNNLAFVIEVVGCAIEVIVAIIAVATLPKVWTDERKERTKKLAEFFGIIAAIIFLVVLVSNRRTNALQEKRLSVEINSAQTNAKIALSKAAEIADEQKPRSFSDEQKAYAHILLGKFNGTPFVMESYADPDSTRFREKLIDLLRDNGWVLVGSMSGGNVYMGKEPLQKTAEPIGVIIEVNHQEHLTAASSLDTFLNGCHIESHLIFVPNPPFVAGGKGVHVRVGTQK
jgi:hypothetical protein